MLHIWPVSARGGGGSRPGSSYYVLILIAVQNSHSTVNTPPTKPQPSNI